MSSVYDIGKTFFALTEVQTNANAFSVEFFIQVSNISKANFGKKLRLCFFIYSHLRLIKELFKAPQFQTTKSTKSKFGVFLRFLLRLNSMASVTKFPRAHS